MKIGEVIKKYRKNIGLTQEEMAIQLGVTAPAVNKWENNNSMPDIMMLAPIARLLGITTDELLSYRDALSAQEINQIILQIQHNLQEISFQDVFSSAKSIIEEYPNCDSLIWQMAVILDSWRTAKDIPDAEKYDDTILRWYDHCLQSHSEEIRTQAADALFGYYVRKMQYEQAKQYISFFSENNPERKRKEALICSKTGRTEEAYRKYEELIFTEYQHLQLTLNDLRLLYMEAEDHHMTKKLVGVSNTAAGIFEMGRYNELCNGLDVAVWEKDTSETARIMEGLLTSLDTLGAFAKSELYQHMDFKPVRAEFIDRLRGELVQSLDDEAYRFMEGNSCWENLKLSYRDILI